MSQAIPLSDLKDKGSYIAVDVKFKHFLRTFKGMFCKIQGLVKPPVDWKSEKNK